MRQTSFALAALCALPGCTGSAGGSDPNLECAALISASSYFMAEGKLDRDAGFDRQALFSSGMYVNKYAIPKGIGEKDAYQQLAGRRAELMASASPQSVFKRAQTCIRKTPKS